MCCSCKGTIAVGDRYRELIAVQSDAFGRSFTRMVAHDECVSMRPEWEVTTRTVLHRRWVRSLDFVRSRYGIEVRPGDRCVALGKPGKVLGGEGKYLRVLLDGHHSYGLYYVRDVVLGDTQTTRSGGTDEANGSGSSSSGGA